MNQVRISGEVVSIARHHEALHFLLKFRLNADGFVRVRILPPLLIQKLQNFQLGCLARVVGWLGYDVEEGGVFVEAFSIITEGIEAGRDVVPNRPIPDVKAVIRRDWPRTPEIGLKQPQR